MHGLVIPVLLVVLAAGLLLLELVTFSGALAFVAAVVYIAGVAIAYYQTGTLVGTIFMLSTMFGGGLLSAVLVKWFPRTSMGKTLFNQPPDVTEIEMTQQRLRSMVGLVGRTMCDMLPGGMVEVEGRRFEAISDAGAIDKGVLVSVVSVRSQRLVVRPYEVGQDPALDQHRAGAPSDAAAATGQQQSWEGEFPDPFADPLA